MKQRKKCKYMEEKDAPRMKPKFKEKAQLKLRD